MTASRPFTGTVTAFSCLYKRFENGVKSLDYSTLTKRFGTQKEPLDHAEQTNLFTKVVLELDTPETTKETITYTQTRKKQTGY